MRWFKHDVNASQDAKIKKLLIRYGATGYAIYFHCLELIASDISETNITFELEHDAEIIADNLKISGSSDKSGVDLVNEIMRFMVNLGLFEDHDGRITCFKILKRLDTSMTSSTKMRSLIAAAKDSHDNIMTQSCKTRLEETRLEEREKSSLSEDPEGHQAEDFHQQPHVVVANSWYRQYAKRTARTVSPAAKDYKRAKEVMDRGYSFTELQQAIEHYFDPENKSFPQWDAKIRQFRYNFANFLANIDSIAKVKSQEVYSRPEALAVQRAPPEKCPECGKALVSTYERAGCRDCGLYFDWNGSEWVRSDDEKD